MEWFLLTTVLALLLASRSGKQSRTLSRPVQRTKKRGRVRDSVLRWESLCKEAISRYFPAASQEEALAFLEATVDHESEGHNVISKPNHDGSRDYGLTQQNSRFLEARGMTTQTAMDPATNIDAGAKLIHALWVEWGGNWYNVASAYNAGSGALSHWIHKHGTGYPNEAYVKLTMSLYPGYLARLKGQS